MNKVTIYGLCLGCAYIIGKIMGTIFFLVTLPIYFMATVIKIVKE